MISTCIECRHTYWRYKPRWETPGFCSWFCRELWRSVRFLHHEDDPGIPVAILELIRSHQQIKHRSPTTEASGQWVCLEWDCAECERLEAQLAAAIAYHMPATPEQIARTA